LIDFKRRARWRFAAAGRTHAASADARRVGPSRDPGVATAAAPANDRPVSPGPLHRDLIERVSNADALQNSRRLRELLVFLCDWSANHPGEAPTEEQVGVAVFGRTPGFDTGADSIVRVQISCLLRKVKEYFRAEGAAEPIVLDLPTRSYAPVFRPRQ